MGLYVVVRRPLLLLLRVLKLLLRGVASHGGHILGDLLLVLVAYCDAANKGIGFRIWGLGFCYSRQSQNSTGIAMLRPRI
jgi:hypothetical protein